MDHPSMYDPDEPDEDDRQLPDGVTEEMVKERLEEAALALSRIGIYLGDQAIAEMNEDGKIVVFATGRIGDLAFSPRVQDPEQAEVNKSFHQFETDAVRDRIEEIKDKFRGKRSNDET